MELDVSVTSAQGKLRGGARTILTKPLEAEINREVKKNDHYKGPVEEAGGLFTSFVICAKGSFGPQAKVLFNELIEPAPVFRWVS